MDTRLVCHPRQLRTQRLLVTSAQTTVEAPRKCTRTFCLDCCTYLDEIPRSKHKETTDVVEAVKKSAWSVQNLAKRVTEPVEMTQRQAAIATRYVAVTNRDLEGVDFVNSTKLIHTLEDCIDYATERGGQSLDLLRHIAAHGTAWEAATRRETEARASGESRPSGETRRQNAANVAIAMMLPEPREAPLPLIDPFTGNEVWVILDEGCNNSCHSLKWRQNAERCLARHDLRCGVQQIKPTSYIGIGHMKCTAKVDFPMSIAMYPSELHIGGTLVSNEMESGDHSLLLSLPAQAKLGLIKDMRIGKGTLREYPDQELKLARVRSTGLLALCISDFVKEQFNEVLKDFHKSSKGMKQSLTDSDVEKWSNKAFVVREAKPETPGHQHRQESV